MVDYEVYYYVNVDARVSVFLWLKRSTNAAASHYKSLGAWQLSCGELRTLPTVQGNPKKALKSIALADV